MILRSFLFSDYLLTSIHRTDIFLINSFIYCTYYINLFCLHCLRRNENNISTYSTNENKHNVDITIIQKCFIIELAKKFTMISAPRVKMENYWNFWKLNYGVNLMIFYVFWTKELNKTGRTTISEKIIVKHKKMLP